MKFLESLVSIVPLIAVACAYRIYDDSTNETEPSEPSYEHYRLPTSVLPEAYELHVVTSLENFTFYGEVIIKIKILEDTNNITLHAQDLLISDSNITITRINRLEPKNKKTEKNCITTSSTNIRYNYLILQLCQVAKEGAQYLLTIPFSGVLNEGLYGYYRSSYQDSLTNETRWLSVTQFEPIAARKAFPCFDEPNLKATFEIKLGHHKDYTALSNMRMKYQTPMHGQDEWIWSIFEESPPMSTYIVAYTVNDFASVALNNTEGENGVLFSTWTHKDIIEWADYSSTVGPKILKYFEEIFDIKFPLSKIDQVAVHDFTNLAMENWGLNIYREKYLLLNQNDSSSSDGEVAVYTTIAHELVHQWFGNLVTMEWWTDLWLNEGFATYFSDLAVQNIKSGYQPNRAKAAQNVFALFSIDGLESGHPVSVPIKDNREIFGMFESLTYGKGSQLVRMMHDSLGDEIFNSSLRRYLKENAYQNAKQDDLWSAFNEEAHQRHAIPYYYDIKTIMDTWTLQKGYPVITVKRNYADETATITQSRYMLDDSNNTTDQSCWWIPLTYTSKGSADFSATTPKAWLECNKNKTSKAIQIGMPNNYEWVIFNLNMTGMYRVLYDDWNWNLLLKTLICDNYKSIDIVSRASLIDNAFALSWTQQQSFNITLRLMQYLINEKEYVPWETALNSLYTVYEILRETSAQENFKKYMAKILTPVYEYLLTLNGTSEEVLKYNGYNYPYYETIIYEDGINKHRELFFELACRFEVDDCVQRSLNDFNDWRHETDLDRNNRLPAVDRGIVYCNAIVYGSDYDWQFLLKRYQNSSSKAERKSVLKGLGCTRNVDLLQYILELTFQQDSFVRKKDALMLFVSVANNDVGYDVAKDFFINNFQLLVEFYSAKVDDISNLVVALASRIGDRDDYEDLKEFLENNKDPVDLDTLDIRTLLDIGKVRSQWKDQNYEGISNTLHLYMTKYKSTFNEAKCYF